MANIHTTSAWPYHVLLRGIDNVIFNKYEERQGVGRELFNVRDSTQYQEDTITVGGVSTLAQKTEGSALTYLSMAEGFRKTFTHLDYGGAFRLTRELLRDAMYPTMEKLAIELGGAALATEETLLANHFNRAQTGGYTGPDGVVLSSTAHIRENGETYANTLSSQADLSQTSLEQALIDFSDQRTGGGRRLAIEPKYLVVPKELRFEAARLTGSTLEPGTDTNAINPLNGLLTPRVWNYLTDTDMWAVLAEKDQHGLVLYDREEFWTDYEYEFETKDYKISGMFAQSSGWEDPRGIFIVMGA